MNVCMGDFLDAMVPGKWEDKLLVPQSRAICLTEGG